MRGSAKHLTDVWFMAMVACLLTEADAGEVADLPFKLTAGTYQVAGKTAGTDYNLRHSSEWGNLWVGHYHDQVAGYGQWRAGWDRSFGESLRILPSMQIATGGFANGSVQAETGEPYFVGIGFGRTNQRPYWNLNFDPNDSYMLSTGYRGTEGQSYVIQYVRDNREHPDQRHLHLVYRQSTENDRRITVDFLYKQGLVEDILIRRWGLAVTHDWPRYFVRLAFDPKANFSTDDMWRISIGTRF